MDNNKKGSIIRKVGPLYVVEGGDFFISPFLSRPLVGYDKDKVLLDEKPFISSIETLAANWYEKFPECCDTHKKLRKFSDFNKSNYDFIPGQIVDNIKFFAYAIELFIENEDWFGNLTDYMDYLIDSLGKPEVGGHIFRPALTGLIEGVKIEGKDFTDDQRIDLLQHLEPKNIIQKSDDDLEVLYKTFQKWVDLIPNFGRFKEMKQQLTGKIPLNIFLAEHQTNRFTGLTKSKFRNQEELLDFLNNMTNEIIVLSKEEFSIKAYDKSHLVIAAEEKLRVSHERFFNKKNSKSEINYLEAIEFWLSIIIEYYQVLNQAIDESKTNKLIDDISEVKNNVNDILSKIDELQIEIAALCNSDRILNWLKVYLNEGSFKKLMEEIDKLDDENQSNKELLDILTSNLLSKGTAEYKIDEIKKKVDSSDLSIKHKLKFSIPLFLFTSYESEIELSDKQKLPKSLKELRALVLK
jgi:hypothetical protein